MVGSGGDGSGCDDARRSEHVELLYEDAGDAGLCVGGYLLRCGRRLCSGSAAVSRTGFEWRVVERASCSASGLGDERVCTKRDVATRIGGKSCVFAAEVSPVPAAGFDHRAVGDELCVAAVSRCDCDWPAHEGDLTEVRAEERRV